METNPEKIGLHVSLIYIAYWHAWYTNDLLLWNGLEKAMVFNEIMIFVKQFENENRLVIDWLIDSKMYAIFFSFQSLPTDVHNMRFLVG